MFLTNSVGFVPAF